MKVVISCMQYGSKERIFNALNVSNSEWPGPPSESSRLHTTRPEGSVSSSQIALLGSLPLLTGYLVALSVLESFQGPT